MQVNVTDEPGILGRFADSTFFASTHYTTHRHYQILKIPNLNALIRYISKFNKSVERMNKKYE